MISSLQFVKKHDLPPLNAKTIGIYPKNANSHKSSPIEALVYFTPEAHARYSYPEIITKHCAGEEGRNTSGPFYEYTLIANNELARDLEESGICFVRDWADNSEHPDFGKAIITFTITKERA